MGSMVVFREKETYKRPLLSGFPRFLPAVFFIALFLFVAYPIRSSAYTTSDGYTIEVSVQNCNNDSVCEELLGETWYGCPLDCTAPVSTSTATTTPAPDVPLLQPAGFYSGAGMIDVINLFKRLFGEDYYGTSTSAQNNNNNSNKTTNNVVLPRETVLVPSPSNVRVSFENGEVILTWDYVAADKVRFRIQRGTNGYPSDYLTGKLIYEGQGNYARDANVVPGREYYYSIYAILNKGKGQSAPLVVKVKVPDRTRLATSTDPLIEDLKPVILEPLTGKDLLCDTYLVPRITSKTGAQKNISTRDLIENGYGPTDNIVLSQDGNISLPSSGIYNIRRSPLVVSFDRPEEYNQEWVVGMCLYRLNSDEKTSSYLFSQTFDKQKLFLVLSPNFIEKYRNPQYIFSIRMVKYGHSPTTLARGIIEVNDNTKTIKKFKYIELFEPVGVGLLRFMLRNLLGI